MARIGNHVQYKNKYTEETQEKTERMIEKTQANKRKNRKLEKTKIFQKNT
ncbi:MAG: hypothetical protein II871_07155 [Clostridia bacterium]|nr:hypothetical protein [Clostridia bacterium]